MKIIERLPIFLDDRDPVVASGERVRTRPRQIIVWASVARYDVAELPSTASLFPAVVDTGFDETFLIQDRHLLEWGGVDCRSLPRWPELLRVYGQDVPLYRANIWLHPNLPGHRDQFSQLPPVCLELPRGIAVTLGETAVGRPRLPLLGMRALLRNSLVLRVDGNALEVGLEQAE